MGVDYKCGDSAQSVRYDTARGSVSSVSGQSPSTGDQLIDRLQVYEFGPTCELVCWFIGARTFRGQYLHVSPPTWT